MSRVIADLAERLADPDSVRPWLTAPLSLSDGYPGLALLYAELGGTDSSYRRLAHAYLQRAAGAVARNGELALYDGPVALAFAAQAAARQAGEYASLLNALDGRIVRLVRERLQLELQRISTGGAGTTFDAYDVISGLTGVGRFLLARPWPSETETMASSAGSAGSAAASRPWSSSKATAASGRGPIQSGRAVLDEVLGYLCALTGPVTLGGSAVPGWWVRHGPRRADAPGHFNLGMAHGIAGPLALLALSWEQGVRVEGQEEAADRIGSWLVDMRGSDADGFYWPGILTRADAGNGRRIRDAWCYGVPGVARALQLAGRAYGRKDWEEAALEAMHALLSRPPTTYGLTEPGLCHGWAGLAYITWLMGRDADDRFLLEGALRLVDRLLDGYDLPERLGFLEGATGVALALHAISNDTPPASRWDAALLVS